MFFMSNQVFLTQQGYDQLQQELKELKENKRKKAVDRLQKARAMGDLTENSEYAAAIEALSFVDSRIQEIEDLLKKAQIINHNNSHQRVEIGSKVTLENQGQREIFTIVGELEANIAEKKLSHAAPIGKALIGKKRGEEVEIAVPAGKIKYKIIDIV